MTHQNPQLSLFSETTDRVLIDAAVLGGAILGGGGGGDINEATTFAQLAFQDGAPTFAEINDLPPDGILITVALVGAPSAGMENVNPDDFCRAVEILSDYMEIVPAGLISNENGPFACVNGWLQSARLGIPVVDAPCNGRAHPFSSMGAMGLHQVKDYASYAAAVGGRNDGKSVGQHIELVATGSVDKTSKLVRQAAIVAGGFVAVARNPISVAHVRDNGAVGALSQAISLGLEMTKVRSRGVEAVIKTVASSLNAVVHGPGQVTSLWRSQVEGFDKGFIKVRSDRRNYYLTIYNEYLTLEDEDTSIATFPDLITLFNAETGIPIPSAEIAPGMEVYIMTADSDDLILGAGMDDKALLNDLMRTIAGVRNEQPMAKNVNDVTHRLAD